MSRIIKIKKEYHERVQGLIKADMVAGALANHAAQMLQNSKENLWGFIHDTYPEVKDGRGSFNGEKMEITIYPSFGSSAKD